MIILIAGCPLKDYTFPTDSMLVGVDLGAMELAKRGIKMTAAIGDFDGQAVYDFDLIDKNASKIVQLSQTKDQTDLEAAITHFPTEQDFLVYGALCGKRLDHLLNQFHIMLKFVDKNITFVDENNEITLLKKGIHIFKQEAGFKYYSFFTFAKATITLNDGFKYPVAKSNLLATNTNFISNELVKDEATLEITEGLVFMIKAEQSKRKV
jgi:thiamine pyrophosphokinase